MTMQVGQTIPDGIYQAFHRDRIRTVQLSEYQGQWLVLMFYPGDFTFVCPTELQEMGSLYQEFQKLGAEVWGVSTDSVYVHKAWHDISPAIQHVQFPMVADPTGRLSRAFGTYLEEEGLSLRGSFLIDPDGVLKVGEIHDNSIGRNGREFLRKLQAAVHVRDGKGEVCPASWNPGDNTLKPGLDLVGKI